MPTFKLLYFDLAEVSFKNFNEDVFDLLAQKKCFNQILWCCDLCKEKVQLTLLNQNELNKAVADLQCRVSKLENKVPRDRRI